MLDAEIWTRREAMRICRPHTMHRTVEPTMCAVPDRKELHEVVDKKFIHGAGSTYLNPVPASTSKVDYTQRRRYQSHGLGSVGGPCSTSCSDQTCYHVSTLSNTKTQIQETDRRNLENLRWIEVVVGEARWCIQLSSGPVKVCFEISKPVLFVEHRSDLARRINQSQSWSTYQH